VKAIPRFGLTNVESTHYILGSVAGPTRYPDAGVRDFHAVDRPRNQADSAPQASVACLMCLLPASWRPPMRWGLFHPFRERPFPCAWIGLWRLAG